MKSKGYKEFVEKFKPKKTTDDCYTPSEVYKRVKDWVIKKYDLEGREIVRPFYPGGDYERFVYPEGCVVLDNPPFSILAKIKKFYTEKGIDYFLFAPALTLFSSNVGNYVVICVDILYDNGAKVNTSFVTSLGEYKIISTTDLHKSLSGLQKKGVRVLPKYKYPAQVVTSAGLQRLVKDGVDFAFKDSEVQFIKTLDAQRPHKKTIFGSGFLVGGGGLPPGG